MSTRRSSVIVNTTGRFVCKIYDFEKALTHGSFLADWIPGQVERLSPLGKHVGAGIKLRRTWAHHAVLQCKQDHENWDPGLLNQVSIERVRCYKNSQFLEWNATKAIERQQFRNIFLGRLHKLLWIELWHTQGYCGAIQTWMDTWEGGQHPKSRQNLGIDLFDEMEEPSQTNICVLFRGTRNLSRIDHHLLWKRDLLEIGPRPDQNGKIKCLTGRTDHTGLQDIHFHLLFFSENANYFILFSLLFFTFSWRRIYLIFLKPFSFFNKWQIELYVPRFIYELAQGTANEEFLFQN